MQSLSGLRILSLASEFPPYPGGIGTYAFGMSQAASELGADVTMLAPDYGETGFRDEALPFRLVRFNGGPHSARDALAKLRLTRNVICGADHEYDVGHAMDWPFFVPAALYSQSRQRRLLSVHGSDANDMAKGYKRLAIAATGVFSAGSEVIANSAYTLGLLRRRFPRISPASLRYEHLGVAEFWHAPVERSPTARSRMSLPPDKFILLTVGRLTRRKGQLHVVQALTTLPAAMRERLVYLIVGQEIDKAYVAELDAAIGCAGFEVRRLQGVDNERLRDLYANCDAFCLTGQDAGDGRVEGFGLVFLEAGAQRLPAIAGAIGAVDEVVLDRRTGLVIPPSDRDALAHAVGCLMENPGLRQALGDGACARAAELSWRRCAERTYAPPEHALTA